MKRVSPRRGLIVAGCVAGAGALSSLVPAAATAGGCDPGVHSYGSAHIRTFCGPAAVTLHMAGKTVKLTGGECTRASQYLAVNIGSVLVGATSKPVPNYFGLDVGKTPGGGKPAPRDGTYMAFANAFAVGGKSYSSISTTVALQGGRTRGSFSGKLIEGGSVSGSFTCS